MGNFQLVEGVEFFNNGVISIWLSYCGCWRPVSEKKCTVCGQVRPALPAEPSPMKAMSA